MSKTIRAIIVDDEKPARDLVREHLAQRSDIEIVDECRNGFEAIRAVSKYDPDVVFLDIQMPKLDGFEVIELFDSDPLVVFVTAYDDYAVKAFEVHAVDYVLKPVNRERIDAVVDRLHERLRTHESPDLAALRAEARGDEPIERIPVRDGDAIEVMPVARLDYIEAQDDYILLVGGDRQLRKLQRMAEIEEQLPDRFVRIHRSYIANIDRIQKIETYAKDSRVAIMRDGTRIPVSRSGYARLREKIDL